MRASTPAARAFSSPPQHRRPVQRENFGVWIALGEHDCRTFRGRAAYRALSISCRRAHRGPARFLPRRAPPSAPSSAQTQPRWDFPARWTLRPLPWQAARANRPRQIMKAADGFGQREETRRGGHARRRAPVEECGRSGSAHIDRLFSRKTDDDEIVAKNRMPRSVAPQRFARAGMCRSPSPIAVKMSRSMAARSAAVF